MPNKLKLLATLHQWIQQPGDALAPVELSGIQQANRPGRALGPAVEHGIIITAADHPDGM